MRGLTACMRCASLELRPLKVLDGGGVPGIQFDLAHCKVCGWQGMPLEFDDEAAWREFVEARKDWPTESSG